MMKNVQSQMVKQKYNTLYRRVSKAVQTGAFSAFTNAKKQSLYNRLKRYERRLKHWGIAVASATALFLTPIALTGQATTVGGEFRVNTTTASYQSTPAVAIDSDGDYVVTWQSNGQDGGQYGVYAQRYNNSGAAQGSEFQVNSHTAKNQIRPAIAMDSDGDFVITWQSYDQDVAPGWGIYAQRYNNSGVAQGSEFLVNTHTAADQDNPVIAMDSDGDFTIAWASNGQDGNSYGVYAQRYDNAGATVGSEFLVNTYTTNNQRAPVIAMDSDGDFTIAWASNGQDGNKDGIYAQRYDNAGATVGSEFLVNTYTTNDQKNPSIAMDSDGDFTIAWQSNGQDGNKDGVYAQRYDNAGATVGSEFLANTHITHHQNRPTIAMDSDGDFTIAWESYNQDGNLDGVYAQQYDNSGATVGNEFLVNTFTTYYQYEPVIAMDNDGDFIVVWEDYYYGSGSQDGDYGGIYAQRYAAAAALPVELTTFTAQAQENQTNLLEWETASEEKNEAFEVEKSIDGKSWEQIGVVDGHGTTVEISNYNFVDESPMLGDNYYRLKQLDFDGQFEYSNIVTVQLEGKPAVFQIYPNPTDDFVTIESNKIGAIVQITNVQGQIVQEFELVESKVQHSINHLAEGVYFIKVGDDVRRVIIQK